MNNIGVGHWILPLKLDPALRRGHWVAGAVALTALVVAPPMTAVFLTAAVGGVAAVADTKVAKGAPTAAAVTSQAGLAVATARAAAEGQQQRWLQAREITAMTLPDETVVLGELSGETLLVGEIGVDGFSGTVVHKGLFGGKFQLRPEGVEECPDQVHILPCHDCDGRCVRKYLRTRCRTCHGLGLHMELMPAGAKTKATEGVLHFLKKELIDEDVSCILIDISFSPGGDHQLALHVEQSLKACLGSGVRVSVHNELVIRVILQLVEHRVFSGEIRVPRSRTEHFVTGMLPSVGAWAGSVVIETNNMVKPGLGQETLLSLMQQRNPPFVVQEYQGARSYARVRVSLADEPRARKLIKEIAAEKRRRTNTCMVEWVGFDSPRD